jgi:hypothetical protein
MLLIYDQVAKIGIYFEVESIVKKSKDGEGVAVDL